MTIVPQPDDIRQLVARTFEEFGVPVENELDLNETLLIQGRKFSARSYRYSGLMAMWLLDAGIIQFYDADGAMLRTVNLFKETRTRVRRMAA